MQGARYCSQIHEPNYLSPEAWIVLSLWRWEMRHSMQSYICNISDISWHIYHHTDIKDSMTTHCRLQSSIYSEKDCCNLYKQPNKRNCSFQSKSLGDSDIGNDLYICSKSELLYHSQTKWSFSDDQSQLIRIILSFSSSWSKEVCSFSNCSIWSTRVLGYISYGTGGMDKRIWYNFCVS